MEATSLSSPMLPRRPFSVKSPCRSRRHLRFRNVNVTAMREMDGRDYKGRIVDENMIVLRMRIQEMKILETSYAPPSHWMEWEKQYYEHYDSDVCEAMGLLQSFLMNIRPSLALGMVALISLSVPISTVVVMCHVMEIANGILAGILRLS